MNGDKEYIKLLSEWVLMNEGQSDKLAVTVCPCCVKNDGKHKVCKFARICGVSMDKLKFELIRYISTNLE